MVYLVEGVHLVHVQFCCTSYRSHLPSAVYEFGGSPSGLMMMGLCCDAFGSTKDIAFLLDGFGGASDGYKHSTSGAFSA